MDHNIIKKQFSITRSNVCNVPMDKIMAAISLETPGGHTDRSRTFWKQTVMVIMRSQVQQLPSFYSSADRGRRPYYQTYARQENDRTAVEAAPE